MDEEFLLHIFEIAILVARGGGTHRKVGGHWSMGHLVHRKFRVKKGTFKYFGPQKWGGARAPSAPPPVPPPLVKADVGTLKQQSRTL